MAVNNVKVEMEAQCTHRLQEQRDGLLATAENRGTESNNQYRPIVIGIFFVVVVGNLSICCFDYRFRLQHI